MYDVAIIGGGLAGLASAIQLAAQGFSVVVFEKKEYPFHRVCGEYVSLEAWAFLRELGLPLETLDLPKINELVVSSPSGTTIKHELNPGGFGISRYLFDQLLAEIAREKNVQLITNTTVVDVSCQNEWEVKTAKETYQAKLVIGSFGKRSTIDQQRKHELKRKKKSWLTNFIGVKYHVTADLPANRIELHNFKDGYCGISKVEAQRYCLCYLTTAKNLKRTGGSIEQLEAEVLMKNPFLNDYFTRFERLYEKPLSISQIDFSKKEIVENKMLMLGDAAGLITPLCGNGMTMALQSASILAAILPAYLVGDLAEDQLRKQYEKQWQETFEKRLKAGRFIQSMFGNATMTNVFISVMKRLPKATDSLIALTHGKPFHATLSR